MLIDLFLVVDTGSALLMSRGETWQPASGARARMLVVATWVLAIARQPWPRGRSTPTGRSIGTGSRLAMMLAAGNSLTGWTKGPAVLGRFGLMAWHITALICDLSEVSEVFFSVLVIFHRAINKERIRFDRMSSKTPKVCMDESNAENSCHGIAGCCVPVILVEYVGRETLSRLRP